MNEHESEKLAGVLTGFGYEPTESKTDADIIVLNTCCVRAGAETRVYGNLGALLPLKRQKPSLLIAVCGCMAQNAEAFETLKSRFPYVDIVFGTHNFDRFGEFLEKRLSAGGRVLERAETEGAIAEGATYRRDETDHAYINIMYGCDNFCSYCIVPYVRGRERSREPRYIIEEARDLIAKGYSEFTLLGQNVNSYQMTNDKGQGTNTDYQPPTANHHSPTTFPELLRDINALPGDFKFTFMTSHPKDLSAETIDAVAECGKIKKEIHLPVQSGSDAVLAAMNRGYTAAQYLGLVNAIRLRIPGCAVSSDVIVGFPGETEEDFAATLNLVKAARFTNLFMFKYSKRPGTKAAEMPGQIPEAIKKRRLGELIEVQREIIQTKNCLDN